MSIADDQVASAFACAGEACSSDGASTRMPELGQVLDFRKNFIEDKLVSLKAEISKSMGDNEKLRSLMQEYAEAQKIRNELARKLGNDIVS